jgi:hypothetical protein
VIVVRNVFYLKFGKSRDAMALWPEGFRMLREAGARNLRLLTDSVGRFYTCVHESEYENYEEFEAVLERARKMPGWNEWHARLDPIIEQGHREIYRIMDV